jgi:hypothetical protein
LLASYLDQRALLKTNVLLAAEIGDQLLTPRIQSAGNFTAPVYAAGF